MTIRFQKRNGRHREVNLRIFFILIILSHHGIIKLLPVAFLVNTWTCQALIYLLPQRIRVSVSTDVSSNTTGKVLITFLYFDFHKLGYSNKLFRTCKHMLIWLSEAVYFTISQKKEEVIWNIRVSRFEKWKCNCESNFLWFSSVWQ